MTRSSTWSVATWLRTSTALCASLLLMIGLLGCEGAEGPAGTPGSDGSGAPGADGTDGLPGTDGTDGADGAEGPAGADGTGGTACWDLDENGEADVATEDTNGDGTVDVMDCRAADVEASAWVNDDAVCAGCHQDQYDMFVLSGHQYKLTEIGGVQPVADATFPYTDYPADLPAGYTWADIGYTIGGYGWKIRYMDHDGYILTCPPGDVDADDDGYCDAECAGSTAGTCDAAQGFVGQYNHETQAWVAYHQGEFQKPYNCGRCHTTGYEPEGNQDGLPGLIGTWQQPGVHCEACHGPGGSHAADPYVSSMEIDRSAEACGRCHIRNSKPGDGAETGIPASGGFIKHHEQWNEMFASTKRVMECTDCHNPHQSARYADATINPNKSIRSPCETCHMDKAVNQASPAMMAGVACVDCHMPRVSKSAVGDAAAFSGDIRTHIFGINTDGTAEQFSADGSKAMPYITLEWACLNCHGVTASAKTIGELELEAAGYHD